MATKHPTVAQFLAAKITASTKTQAQIASECDWKKPNVITMLKQGLMKMPLDKVGLLASALEINAAHLLRMCLREYMPDTLSAIEQMNPGLLLSHYESEIINAYREVAGTGEELYSVAIFKTPFTLVDPHLNDSGSTWTERGPHAMTENVR